MSAPRVSLAGIRARYAKIATTSGRDSIMEAIDDSVADIPALLDLVDEARRLLEALEWEGCDASAMPACPICRADAPDYEKRGRRDEYERHREGCTLRAWLAGMTDTTEAQ